MYNKELKVQARAKSKINYILSELEGFNSSIFICLNLLPLKYT